MSASPSLYVTPIAICSIHEPRAVLTAQATATSLKTFPASILVTLIGGIPTKCLYLSFFFRGFQQLLFRITCQPQMFSVILSLAQMLLRLNFQSFSKTRASWECVNFPHYIVPVLALVPQFCNPRDHHVRQLPAR